MGSLSPSMLVLVSKTLSEYPIHYLQGRKTFQMATSAQRLEAFTERGSSSCVFFSTLRIKIGVNSNIDVQLLAGPL